MPGTMGSDNGTRAGRENKQAKPTAATALNLNEKKLKTKTKGGNNLFLRGDKSHTYNVLHGCSARGREGAAQSRLCSGRVHTAQLTTLDLLQTKSHKGEGTKQ